MLAAAALLPLLMAGCTINYYNNYPAPADAANPLVLVKDGRVSVNAEPLYFSQKDGAVTITWRLPAGGPYSFADNGIVVGGATGDAKQAAATSEEFQCRKVGPTEFACLNRNSRPGVYKYTVRVNEGSKALKPLDPIIANEW
jgi:hypothetical protein